MYKNVTLYYRDILFIKISVSSCIEILLSHSHNTHTFVCTNICLKKPGLSTLVPLEKGVYWSSTLAVSAKYISVLTILHILTKFSILGLSAHNIAFPFSTALVTKCVCCNAMI